MGFYDEQFEAVTRPAGEDLTGAQYHFVELDSDGDVEKVGTAGDQPFGVLRNDPDDGEAATVAVRGITSCVAGAEITVGAKVGVDGDGKARPVESGDAIVGWAITAAGGDGKIFGLDFRTYLGTES